MMIGLKKGVLLLSALLAAWSISAQDVLETSRWKCRIAPTGYIEQLIFKNNERNDTIPFLASKRYGGPSFYVRAGGKEQTAEWSADGQLSYKAMIGQIGCRMNYLDWNGLPALQLTVENKGYVPFRPEKAGLRLGVDIYMDKYPDWFEKYFPTLMMNEKTHFYGYMQSPSGKLLGLVSPQPVASWSVTYNLGYQDPAPHWFMGHRIESLNLDLLNTLPLPTHCPQDLWQLNPGESKTWILAFVSIPASDALETTLHEVANIPMLRIAQTVYSPQETASFDVLAKTPYISMTDAQGKSLQLDITDLTPGVKHVTCRLPEAGLYSIRVEDGGKQTHGMLSAHASWQWTMEKARKAALKYHQKATSHAESWYGFYSAFLAAKYFPDAVYDEPLRKRFDYLFNLLHDSREMKPLYYASRIQNTSTTIGMLIDKYQAYGDVTDLEAASRLADWLMDTWQREDGAYVNHNVVYTSVIYIAKSMMELVLAERRYASGGINRQAPVDSVHWRQLADRHYRSVQRSVDQLVASDGNFETEGEMTFEDGMISCSALQIGMFALMQTDADIRHHYTKKMLEILYSHDCLTQLRVPDARRRGGTMRYWEAQYDVQILPNMFNSPHGWSAWRTYVTYYAYLLTGEERWLRETYNALGAFANLVDVRTGDLRWAFVVDPYLKVKQACSADTRVTADSLSFGNPHPELYDTREFVIGEQYVDMISDWQGVNTQDNDVHEVFKCLGESLLTNAFVIEREDGSLIGYNCTVERKNNQLKIIPAEKQITNLHGNLRHAFRVSFCEKEKTLSGPFLGWVFGQNPYQ